MTSFEILTSNKAGLNSRESYIVVRNRVSFLRILGANPQWELMTATASEDNGRIKVCNNRPRLVQAAWRLGVEIETRPEVKSDWALFPKSAVRTQLPQPQVTVTLGAF